MEKILKSPLAISITKPSAFLTLTKLSAALPLQKKYNVRVWMVLQNAYTLHTHVRRRVLRNPYIVKDVMDFWESNLLYVQYLAKHNDMHRNFLSVINVFSKYLYLVPVKTKNGLSISSSVRSIFHDDESSTLYV